MKKLTICSITALAALLVVTGVAFAEIPYVIESGIQDQLGPNPYDLQVDVQQNQAILDDTPYQMADPDLVQPIVEPDLEEAANDCYSLESNCKVYDEFNNELPDNDCDCVEEYDRFGDPVDNCPTVKNMYQDDMDGDGKGDACTDTDGDTVMDDIDNCIDIQNLDQADTDGDTVGDACEDTDNDGWLDGEDNCPDVGNPSQQDTDTDGVGDGCDNCPLIENVTQLDADFDGQGDACSDDDDGDTILDEDDNCPKRYNLSQEDEDQDGLGDLCDNCPDEFNPDQIDENLDGIGDVCEEEIMASIGGVPGVNFADGGCSMTSAASAAGGLASMLLLTIALAPMVLRSRRKR